MKFHNIKRGLQRGFTLVELAIVLVIAGIILVSVLKGTDAINKAKVERMVSDVRGLAGIAQEFEKRNGRFAGDCDNNSIVEVALPLTPTLLNTFTVQVGAAAIYDMVEANRNINGIAATGVATPNTVCVTAASAEGDINQVWNEFRRAGVVDANRLPRELARHSMGDVFAIGTISDATNTAGVIVIYGIPVWMAEAIDASIDGQATNYNLTATATGGANIGRVRLWSGNGTPMGAGALATAPNLYTAGALNSYDEGANDRDRLIAISYQYTTNKLVQ